MFRIVAPHIQSLSGTNSKSQLCWIKQTGIFTAAITVTVLLAKGIMTTTSTTETIIIMLTITGASNDNGSGDTITMKTAAKMTRQ